ncbi:unannotated protein [freshwater metagenome]|uniref:Unannotated protein n=1 Tax=freshwater metagenome TaxID=449393 RepID=A0A6J7S152_9ZZZZ
MARPGSIDKCGIANPCFSHSAKTTSCIRFMTESILCGVSVDTYAIPNPPPRSRSGNSIACTAFISAINSITR